ncbi:MAG: HAD-IIB family hydrolase, partial [Immundisolibacteraceae bacterium]|nr:HAD-IIB family hydrolase [Immundisolibacteraceae bacterium]
MESIRLLIFDIDGTLINKDGKISDPVKDALKKASKMGIKLALATGRPAFAAIKIINDLSIDATCAFYNGALITRPLAQTAISKSVIQADDLIKARQEANKRDIYYELYTVDDYYVEKITPLSQVHKKYLGRLPTVEQFEKTINHRKILKMGLIAPRDSRH